MPGTLLKALSLLAFIGLQAHAQVNVIMPGETLQLWICGESFQQDPGY